MSNFIFILFLISTGVFVVHHLNLSVKYRETAETLDKLQNQYHTLSNYYSQASSTVIALTTDNQTLVKLLEERKASESIKVAEVEPTPTPKKKKSRKVKQVEGN